MHRSEKGVGEFEIPFFIAGESELVSHAGKPHANLKARRKRGDRLVRKFDRTRSGLGIQERKQGLGEPGKISIARSSV